MATVNFGNWLGEDCMPTPRQCLEDMKRKDKIDSLRKT